jgi:hypothetical protein
MIKLNIKSRNVTSQKDESGIISLIIVAILAVVMALVAIGFAKLTDRELTQASDRELSAQAFYAAEAGINDARAYLLACEQTNTTPGGCDFPGCVPPASANGYFVKDLDGTGGAKYTCVSVNTQPPDLIYPLDAGQSKTIKLSTSGLPNVFKLFFGWNNQNYKNTLPGSGSPLSPNFGPFGTLPQESSTTNPATTGVLRVDIYPVPNGATNNDALAGLSRTYYLYPNGGLRAGTFGSIALGSGGYSTVSGPISPNGGFLAGNCWNNNTNPVVGSGAAASYCNSAVTGLSGSTNADYYVRLTAMYTAQNVTIQATNNSNNNQPISGTQGVIDVTGKGTDVLQRIRDVTDLTNQPQAPSYGLQSMVAICKGFTLEIDGIGTYGGVNTSTPNNDNACIQPNGNGSLTGGGLGPH